jgi:hypothetical protein
MIIISNSIFSLPIDDKNLPQSWKKLSSGYIHIESGIGVHNSRGMNRVLQLLFYYAPNSTSYVGANSISVQEAVRRSRIEYKEYKVRLAANKSEWYNTCVALEGSDDNLFQNLTTGHSFYSIDYVLQHLSRPQPKRSKQY